MSQKDRAVEVAETTVVVTDAEAAEDTVVVETAETIVVETDAEAAEDTVVVETAVTTVVVIDAEAAEDTEAVEIAETIVVETDVEAGHEEKAKAGVAMIHVISDRTQIAHHAVNTKEVMTANQGAVIQEDLEAGGQKARVEAIVAEISRGVFI